MIDLENISKTYYGKKLETPVLHEINLSVEKGEFVSLVGRSGSGKSTLLNIIGLMDDANCGKYFFNGENVMNLSQSDKTTFRSRKVGFVFQAFHLITELSALENIAVPMGYAGVSAKDRKVRAKLLLEQVGLSHRAGYMPAELSGGEKQRVAIARALANNPELILADEPTGNLDKANATEITELLKALNAQGTTIIMVTHDAQLAQIASRRLVLDDGRLTN